MALADLPSSDIAACRAGEREGRLITVHLQPPPAESPGSLSIPGEERSFATWHLR